MRLGTDPKHCRDGVCYCDKQTGACPCRPNVVGLSCNECAPHHWNLGMDGGCEPCSCHPENSHAQHCNLVRLTLKRFDLSRPFFQPWLCVFCAVVNVCSSLGFVTAGLDLEGSSVPSVNSTTGVTRMFTARVGITNTHQTKTMPVLSKSCWHNYCCEEFDQNISSSKSLASLKKRKRKKVHHMSKSM